MTHRTRIVADRLIGTPAAFFFNAIARILGMILRRDHSVDSTNVKRIVVAKLIGMGSILQATPLLRALKEHYPDARLTFVTMHSSHNLVSRLPYVDEIVALDDRNPLAMVATTIQAVATLVRRRADLYFDLELYSAFASLLALWAVTRNRIGFYRHSTSFKRGIYTHLVFFNTRMPVRQLYLQLARVVAVPTGQSETIGPIRIDESDRAGVEHELGECPDWQLQEPYIVLNPNASDLLLERRWPAEYVVETIERLVSEGHQLALIGLPAERPYVETIFERLSTKAQSRVANTAGRLTLGELLLLLSEAACVLTNDTGPMHMAIALGRPTVCLFGPVHPDHYGERLPNVEIFYFPVFCSPCVHESETPPCGGDNICMQRIKPRLVVEAVLRLVRTDPADGLRDTHGRIGRVRIVSETPDGTPMGVVVRPSLQRVQTL